MIPSLRNGSDRRLIRWIGNIPRLSDETSDLRILNPAASSRFVSAVTRDRRIIVRTETDYDDSLSWIYRDCVQQKWIPLI